VRTQPSRGRKQGILVTVKGLWLTALCQFFIDSVGGDGSAPYRVKIGCNHGVTMRVILVTTVCDTRVRTVF